MRGTRISVLGFPRDTKPELIEPGDRVRVTFPEDGGVTVRREGVVSKLQRHIGVVHLLTADGAVLGRYRPGERSLQKYTLLDRAPLIQEPLSLFDDLERIR